MRPEELPPHVRRWAAQVLRAALELDHEVVLRIRRESDTTSAELPAPPYAYDNDVRAFARWLEEQ